MEVGSSEIQGHPQLQSQVPGQPGIMGPCLKSGEGLKADQEPGLVWNLKVVTVLSLQPPCLGVNSWNQARDLRARLPYHF